MKTLVVFYSRSGRTRDIGGQIAQRLGADVEEIRTKRSYEGFFGLWRSLADALRGAEFAIEAPQKTASDYDIVVVGAPVWGGRAAPPVLTYLRQAEGAVRKAACFVTSGGAPRAGAFEEMEATMGAKSVANLALDRGALRSRELGASLDRFAGSVKASG
ncbi:MAG: flavodoxin [Candidatus Bipolaricaulota bacterium]